MRVVPALDVLEDGEARLGLRLEPGAIEQLTLERGEEALANGVDAPYGARVSSRGSCGFGACGALPVIGDETVIHLAGEVAFQAADDVFLRQALGRPAGEVVDGRLVPAHAHDDDPIERRIRLPMATPKEPVAVRDATGCRDRTGPAEFREGSFGADPFRIVAGDDHHLGRGVGADPERLA